MNILSKRDFWSVACTQNNEIEWFDNIRAFEWMQWKLRCLLLYCFRMCCFHCILRKKNIFLAFFWRSRYFSSIKLSHVNTSSYFSTTQNVQKRILSVVLFFPNQLFFIIRDNAWPMLCASYSRNPREGRYWPVIYYVIIVDTQHTNILINTNRISESQKIDKNSAVICSGKLSDIINIKKIYAWPSLLHFEFELNMSSSDDLLSQAQ